MKETDSLREHLLGMLKSRNAHADFDAAVADFPPALRGVKPKGVPYSAWELLEHIRLAQSDILEFSRDPSTSRRNGRTVTGPRRRLRRVLPPGTRASRACAPI